MSGGCRRNRRARCRQITRGCWRPKRTLPGPPQPAHTPASQSSRGPAGRGISTLGAGPGGVRGWSGGRGGLFRPLIGSGLNEGRCVAVVLRVGIGRQKMEGVVL